MKYEPALLVANSILYQAYKNGQAITHMKLQKLIYFVYKKYLEDTGHTLFDESILAWKHGPVVQSVYNVFKSFGASEIVNQYAMLEGDKNPQGVSSGRNDFHSALNHVLWKYGNYSGWHLRELTHNPGGAWKKAYEKDMSNEINVNDIWDEEWHD